MQQLPIYQPNDRERLTIMQALYKVVASAVSTKEPGNLRNRVDSSVLQFYDSTGCKSYDLTLMGNKVGTLSLRFSKEVHERFLEVVDYQAFERWAFENGHAKKQIVLTIDVEDWMPKNLVNIEYMITEETWRKGIAQENYVMDVDEVLTEAMDSGEIPDGCEMRVIDEPAKPIGTLLKVDPQRVAKAMGDALPTAVAGLLTSGGE